jgi:hypothetical protein
VDDGENDVEPYGDGAVMMKQRWMRKEARSGTLWEALSLRQRLVERAHGDVMLAGYLASEPGCSDVEMDEGAPVGRRPLGLCSIR